MIKPIVVFFFSFITFSAFAADSVEIVLPSVEPQSVSELGSQPHQKSFVERSSALFFASTWSPRNIELSSKLSDTSTFDRRYGPFFGFAFLSEPLLGGASSRVGILRGFAELSGGVLSRSATGYSGKEHRQYLNLLYPVIGAEFAPGLTRWNWGEAILGAGVGPFIGQTTDSALLNGQTYVTPLFKAFLGASLFPFKKELLREFGVTLKLVQTLGQKVSTRSQEQYPALEHERLNMAAFEGGVRWAL